MSCEALVEACYQYSWSQDLLREPLEVQRAAAPLPRRSGEEPKRKTARRQTPIQKEFA